MRYTMISTQPKNAEKAINNMAQSGWRVVSQSESTWVISKCFGLSRSVDAVINIVLAKEN